MLKCKICKFPFKEWQIDDPLHSTNWKLPDGRSADICSSECHRILSMQYEVGKLIAVQEDKGRTRLMKEAILRVREVQVPLLGLDDKQIRALYYNIQEALELDE